MLLEKYSTDSLWQKRAVPMRSKLSMILQGGWILMMWPYSKITSVILGFICCCFCCYLIANSKNIQQQKKSFSNLKVLLSIKMKLPSH